MGNCIINSQLQKCTCDDTPEYNFKDKVCQCKVLSCYDGDTITVAIRLESKIFKMKVRMYGYDSPEMKPPKSDKNRDKEIIAAKKAKKAIEDKILNKLVKIKIHGFDKYGRLLGTVYLNEGYCSCISVEENINQYMIENNYGYCYSGGTKEKIQY